MRAILSLVAGILALFFVLNTAVAATNPQNPAKLTILTAMKIGSDALRRHQSLRQILPFFDTREITRLSISPIKWLRLSENEKREKERQYSESMLDVLSSILTGYIDAEATFTSQSGDGKYVQLTGVVTPKAGESIKVTWWLRCAAKKCRMTNVIIGGYSLVDLVKSEQERNSRNLDVGR